MKCVGMKEIHEKTHLSIKQAGKKTEMCKKHAHSARTFNKLLPMLLDNQVTRTKALNFSIFV